MVLIEIVIGAEAEDTCVRGSKGETGYAIQRLRVRQLNRVHDIRRILRSELSTVRRQHRPEGPGVFQLVQQRWREDGVDRGHHVLARRLGAGLGHVGDTVSIEEPAAFDGGDRVLDIAHKAGPFRIEGVIDAVDFLPVIEDVALVGNQHVEGGILRHRHVRVNIFQIGRRRRIDHVDGDRRTGLSRGAGSIGLQLR